MSTGKLILLYNPPSEFYAMPLGLLAVGSAVDEHDGEVRIYDSRIGRGREEKLLEDAPAARCVGMTVFSGAPIQHVLSLSRKLKERYPKLPVVWGGWHPSILPEQCIASGAVDAVVIGQGESPFRELIESIDQPDRWSEIPGLCLAGQDGPRRTAPRPLEDMNSLPPVRYELLDVESYFHQKGIRQLDYSSSRGCPYRCTFCADPIIYRSRWTALTAERTVGELLALHRRYGMEEVSFLDDDLFASLKRIRALVEALIVAGASFGWKGAARADELTRLPESFFSRLQASGCRRVTIGAESGSQKILDRIKKQYRVEQIIDAGQRLANAGIGASYSFISGFPGETGRDFQATLDVIKRVRQIAPTLQATIFFYSPYPGTELIGELESRGVTLPTRLEDWAGFTIDSTWLADPKGLAKTVRNLNFYLRHGYAANDGSFIRRMLRSVSRVRCEYDWYHFPIEPYLARIVS